MKPEERCTQNIMLHNLYTRVFNFIGSYNRIVKEFDLLAHHD